MKQNQIHIPINRNRLKIAGLIYAILALVVFAGAFVISENFEGNWQIAIKVTGGIVAVILILTGAGALKLLNDKSAGITIDSNGILDKSNSISVGFISLKQIIEMEPRKSERVILIHLKNNNDIVKSASNRAIKQLLERNIAIYKTPVILESKYLSCSFDELVSFVQSYITNKK